MQSDLGPECTAGVRKNQAGKTGGATGRTETGKLETERRNRHDECKQPGQCHYRSYVLE